MSNKHGSLIEIAEASITLEANQIITLNSNPIEVIPAPGVGRFIEILYSFMRINFNTIPFDNSENILLLATPDIGFVFLEFDNCLNFDSDKIKRPSAITSLEFLPSDVENKPVNITTVVDATQGDGTIDLYISYRILTL
jgi:hypothetical protein